ncbi:MAG TPA: pantoate--beta-alanine ligase [Bacteroidota bacterium]|nr:pantoate--beta-alanine ligase [Bacteroidota bacterium]
MKVITSIAEMQSSAEALRRQGKSIGVVPTMGYLHEGHLSLIRVAKQRSDAVITTIFVNPAQFSPNEDLSKYPRDLERDKKLAQSAGTDILFVPDLQEIYPPGYSTFVTVEHLTSVLEGEVRPTHFRGVTTIVAKLFNITKPHIAVFGQKDAQQAVVIQRMAVDLNFDTQIIIAPIMREADGLAMSSRNVYLSLTERSASIVLYESLKLAEKLIRGGERKSDNIRSEMNNFLRLTPSATVDYVSIADPSTLQEKSTLAPGETVLVSLAVRIGVTRLIDNALINV